MTGQDESGLVTNDQDSDRSVLDRIGQEGLGLVMMDLEWSGTLILGLYFTHTLLCKETQQVIRT